MSADKISKFRHGELDNIRKAAAAMQTIYRIMDQKLAAFERINHSPGEDLTLPR